MDFFGEYVRSHKLVIGTFVLFIVILSASFALYRLPLGAVLYPAVLCVVAGTMILWIDYHKALKKHRQLQRMNRMPAALIDKFPEPASYDEKDYVNIIQSLAEECKATITMMNNRISDINEYYTMWVHQIKTPIAAMKLSLEGQDSSQARRMAAELFRIEQYVEMVMVFLRLDSDQTDYVFRTYDLDNILRQSIKRFSGEFIQRKISLDYRPAEASVITDEKWLSFIIEQILSNALKYTKEGSITITFRNEKLYIRDTGIGIAPEDLPRIFQKGYTGYNGRSDKRASGIGLYLVKKICDNMGHDISVTSQVGKGTLVCLDLSQYNLEAE